MALSFRFLERRAMYSMKRPYIKYKEFGYAISQTKRHGVLLILLKDNDAVVALHESIQDELKEDMRRDGIYDMVEHFKPYLYHWCVTHGFITTRYEHP